MGDLIFDLVDVFGARAISGNPLGVLRGAGDLSGEQMLALTRWLGFSETTILSPPTDPAADYQVRIFSPAGELPFAGHPTLGSCHAWLAAGGKPRQNDLIVQQCGVGLVEIKREGELLSFKAPPLRRSGVLDPEEIAKAAEILNIASGEIVDAAHGDNGPAWRLLRLKSAQDVLSLRPQSQVTEPAKIGVFGAYESGSDIRFEVRGFFAKPDGTLTEDPVTGSLNAAIAQYVFANGLAERDYRAAQGRKVGSDGIIHCAQDEAGNVWVGGNTQSIASSAIFHAPL